MASHLVCQWQYVMGYLHVCVRTRTRAYVWLCRYACMRTRAYACVCVCVCVYVCVCVCAYVCVCVGQGFGLTWCATGGLQKGPRALLLWGIGGRMGGQVIRKHSGGGYVGGGGGGGGIKCRRRGTG